MFKQRPLLVGFLVGALLTVQALASAHELDHALHQHDDALCALHVYAASGGNTPIALCHFVIGVTPHTHETVKSQTLVSLERAYDYRARAPPVSA